MDWQPIETAPKAGCWVGPRLQLYVPPYGAMSGHWDIEVGKWILHACLNKEAQPTHWAHLLPPPPASEQHERKGAVA